MSSDGPRARGDVVFRQLDDEWVVFDPARDRLHTLNLSAALVWSHLDGAHDAGSIAAVVAAAFEQPGPRESVARDIGAAIERFRAAGLLER